MTYAIDTAVLAKQRASLQTVPDLLGGQARVQ
jgi:hypothetical protein